eukprot:gene4691-20646_t
MNPQSSRSHAVLQLVFTQTLASAKPGGGRRRRTSTVMLADLAGGGQQKRTGTEGAGLREACHTNTGLHHLRK